MIAIDHALRDPMLLGAALGDATSWSRWLAVLRAAFGLPLDQDQAATFAKIAGDRAAPTSRVQELHCIVGRRGGKSRIAAAIASFIAAFDDHKAKLAPGETGFVVVLAPTKDQAAIIYRYIVAYFQQSPVLRQEIETIGANELQLRGNITIAVHPNSFRSVRGRTLLAAIFDETAFMRSDDSALPDKELYRAVLPALATTGGMLISISSPYRRAGLMFEKHRDHFGKEGDVLVIQAATRELNPTLDAGIIDRAKESDPEAARAEWDAEFRSDISALLDDELIDAAIEPGRPLELPPITGVGGRKYFAFADASAGRHDAFTFCIGHREGTKENPCFVADVVRGVRPPFDPNHVAAEFASLAKQYGVSIVTGDNYAGDFVKVAFERAGVTYRRCEAPKSALYLEMVPFFTRAAIEIPNFPPLLKELRLLERRTHRSGRDSVDANGGRASEDHANALAGCCWIATHKPKSVAGVIWGDTPAKPRDEFAPRFEWRERTDGLPGRVLVPAKGFREEDLSRASSSHSTGERRARFF